MIKTMTANQKMAELLLIPGDSRPPIPVILGHPC